MRSAKSLGDYGEQIVKTHFEDQGYNVELSEDQYDSEKDMTIEMDGDVENVEVKTEVVMEGLFYQNSWHYAFSLKGVSSGGYGQTNLNKCLNVDRLMCVIVPWAKLEDGQYHYYNSACIYEFPKERRKEMIHSSDTNMAHLNMYYIPLTSLDLAAKLSDDTTVQLLNRTSAQFRTGFGWRAEGCMKY